MLLIRFSLVLPVLTLIILFPRLLAFGILCRLLLLFLFLHLLPMLVTHTADGGFTEEMRRIYGEL